MCYPLIYKKKPRQTVWYVRKARTGEIADLVRGPQQGVEDMPAIFVKHEDSHVSKSLFRGWRQNGIRLESGGFVSQSLLRFSTVGKQVHPLRAHNVKPLAFFCLFHFSVLGMTIGKEVRRPKIPNWACFIFSSWKPFFEFETKNQAGHVPEDKKLSKVNYFWSP
jgi:hypothetical protein